MKKLALFLILVTMSFSSFSAGKKALYELIVERGIKQVLMGDKMLKSSADQVEEDMLAAVLGLSGKENPTPQEFIDAITALDAKEAEDIALRSELVTLLSKEDANAQDIIEAKRKMLILATNLGKLDSSTLLACGGACASGLRLHKITNPVVADIASSIPNDRKTLLNTVRASLRKTGMGRMPRNLNSVLGDGDLRTLAIYLKLAGDQNAKASSGQRAMIEAIQSFSSAKGKTELLNEDNPHLFFKHVIAGEFSDEELHSIASILKRASQKSETLEGRKEAFFKELEDLAGDDPTKKQRLASLRAKNCFFK